jgi:curved DNA-binding protein
MDYYSTLGLKPGASAEDIKRAYRSLAMKHHPDRGGDEHRFKEINQAYETLSDPQKKQIIDMGGDPNHQNNFGPNPFQGDSPFEFHFNSNSFEDIFNHFGFGFRNQSNIRRNKSFNINVVISLQEVLTGKDISAEVGLPGGRSKIVNISIPPGVETGQQIRYHGMGDDYVKDSRPGDLIVNVVVEEHKIFRRENDNIVCDKIISVWDAMLGTKIQVDTLDNKKIDILIPPGTQSETVLSCRGEGLPSLKSKIRGSLLVKIRVEIPRLLTERQKEYILKIRDGI